MCQDKPYTQFILSLKVQNKRAVLVFLFVFLFSVFCFCCCNGTYSRALDTSTVSNGIQSQFSYHRFMHIVLYMCVMYRWKPGAKCLIKVFSVCVVNVCACVYSLEIDSIVFFCTRYMEQMLQANARNSIK